ncbi:MAG TPA: AMP-binding protein [Acetobacteraceae bacterium]|nr:AMP-binding protein [Acetobacteraceae bacterium]
MNATADSACREAPLLPALLHRRATEHGARVALRFLRRGEHLADQASYADLDAAARIAAANLLSAGLARRPVLLALPQGLDFVRCFLGCLYAGAIAVPTPALADPRGAERIAAIAAQAQPAALIATPDHIAAGETLVTLRAAAPAIRALAPADVLAGPALASPAGAGADAIAFLQYTSGSTSRPKGIVITHGNIAANLAMIRAAFAQDEGNSTVSWLPLHHDMGLIGCVLEPLSLGAEAVLMSPLAFLQKPLRWLRALAAYGATTAGAPNFGYELCARAVDEAAARTLDLSRWRLAFCGSEPVRATTLARFAARFAPSGFAAEAFYPCYGLAEATLFVTGGAPGSGVRERALPRPAGGEIRAVSCGAPRGGAAIALLRQDVPEHVAPGAIGEIAVAGPQLSPGFWDAARGIVPDAAREVRLDGQRFLRTGDLGALQDGGLHVVGRLKDMIIVRGANIFAEDVEQTVLAHPAAAALGAVAALALADIASDSTASEGLILACEAARGVAPARPAEMLAALATVVAQAHGVLPTEIVLLPAGGIERTLSGKLQRARTRERLAQGALPILARFAAPRPAPRPAA